MDRSFVRTVKCSSYLALVLAILGSTCLTATAQDTNKKKSSAPAPAAAPAKPAAAPSRPAAAPASRAPSNSGVSRGPTTSGASHGPTTGGMSHGPTTAGPSASGASHGPTTSNPAGPRTTTGSASHGPTTGGPSASGASHGPTTSNPTGPRTTTTTGGPSAGSASHGPTTGGPSHGPITGNAAGGRTAPTVGGGSRGPTQSNPGATAGRPAPAGSHETHTANGNAVRTRANGTRSDVHDVKRGMDIHRGLNGNRRISVERADHSRIVAERGGRGGYVHHPYMYHGHEFGRRTYYYNGRVYDRYYRGYYYRGGYVNVYAPAYYYGPGFYGWAYNPWPAPIVYSWGWGAYPWYGYYGGYFAPYPVYPSAAFWLTDYLIAQSLAAAYQEQVDDQVAATRFAGGSPVLTPEVKQMISEEVKRQVALENSEAQANAQNQDIDPASSGIARMLSDNQTHVFIAGTSLDLVDTSGGECGISQGDVLEVTSAPPPDATAATAVVLCSKGGRECSKSAQVSVPFPDLQDMQNHMRETIDQGLGDLQAKQGQGGLPAAPPSAKSSPVQSAYVAAAPPADPNVPAEIKQETQAADQAEREVASAVPSGPPGVSSPTSPAPSAPVRISEGQTVDEVTAALGQPKSVVDLGTKKIYVYPDMKVTFKGGKVSDVQ